jgi:DNA-binding MarR family transcriptional regulator
MVALRGRFGYVYGVANSSQEFYERFAAVYRCIRGLAEQAYAAIDVGSTQAKFLRHIGANSRMSQAELARVTQTAPTLTGRVLDALVEHGWVRRERSTEDRREYTLELTAAGKRVRDRVVQARESMIRRLARVLDERDVEDFDRIAAKILTSFGE